MAKTTEKHVIADDIYIYKVANSSRWSARFKIGTQWVAKSTKVKDIQQATVKAIELRAENQTKADNNLPIFTGTKSKANTFTTIANKAIERMEVEIAKGSGKLVFNDYILVLKKYHIPYFDNKNIKDIDENALLDFDIWRTEQLKRVPAKSTINTHNSAFQRVFDEAVIGKNITASEVPALKNEGQGGKRRAAFTGSEYLTLLKAAEHWIAAGKQKIIKDTRTLLYYYIQFAVLTGMRPGKEIEHLTWGDVHERTNENGIQYTMITVRKGKTTMYTGTREIVCKDGIKAVLNDMKATLERSDKDDLIFTLPDGKSSAQLGRNFGKLLDKLGLKYSAYGDRTLYSLRHSYITWKLQQKVNISVIAAQCGTSVEMIERHYSHLVPSMFAEQLSGAGGSLDLTSSADASVLDFSTTYDSNGTLVIKDGVIKNE